MTKDALLNQLERMKEKHQTKVRLAVKLGVSAQYLNDVMAGKREPGDLLLKGMGLERVVSYRTRVHP